MKRHVDWTMFAVLPLLSSLVACTGFAPTSVATPTAIPPSVTTTSQSTPPTAVVPTTAPTQAPTAATKPTLAATVSASPAATVPQVISFTVAPTTTHRIGEKMTAAWQAKGTQATLCPAIWGSGGAPVEQAQACSVVPLVGTKSINIDENAVQWMGLQLRVTAGETSVQSLVQIKVGCQGLRDWFFGNAPLVCPQTAVIRSPGAAQHFEHGFMVWVKQPDTFYVFYETNQQPPRVFEQIRAPYSFTPGASPNNRIGQTPPHGLYEPVSGFGQVWRGEFEGVQNVRQRLGWATDQEFSFDSSYQCETSLFPRLWTCYLSSPDGKVLVLRPDSTAQAHFIWDVR